MNKSVKPILLLNNFGFAFEGEKVLQGLNFSLNKGDFLYVVGPNGAGKSTLLKALLRLHERGEPTGEIVLKGRILAEYSRVELARLLSYVPQAEGWIPPFTVSAFVELSRFSYRKGGNSESSQTSREVVARALRATSMDKLAARPLWALSGGERQRAYVAAALAQEAEIMSLDEPTAFLDPRHAAELNQLLSRLNKTEGLTLICITHELNQAFAAENKILVLGEGSQLYFGETAGLLDGEILNRAFKYEFTIFRHPRHGCPVVLV